VITERSQARVDVKHAVRSALDFVRDIYSEEKISNLGLEEVSFDDGVWSVTLGFSRPWDRPRDRRPAYDLVPGTASPEPPPERDYKVVKIDAETGTVLGMVMREE